MTKATIIYLIKFYSALYGMDSRVMVAVAQHESGFNVNAVGTQKEVGLFQIKPEYVKGFSRQQLFDPETNIKVGIQRLAEEKKHCIHKADLGYLVCYNFGEKNAKRVHHPSLFPYVVAVKKLIAYNK